MPKVCCGSAAGSVTTSALFTRKNSNNSIINVFRGSGANCNLPQNRPLRLHRPIPISITRRASLAISLASSRWARVWPENSIRRIPRPTKGCISVRNFGTCESASAPETPRIKQETPKSWTRRIPPACQPFMTDGSGHAYAGSVPGVAPEFRVRNVGG